MKNIGVVVGRFQIDELHDGHIQLFRAAVQNTDVLCVVLGTTENLGSKRNPLDFVTRKAMVDQTFAGMNFSRKPLVVLAAKDDASDKVWSENLDAVLRATFPGDRVKLYGSRDSFSKHYAGSFQQVYVDSNCDATASSRVRLDLAGTPLPTRDFRRGVIYGAYNQWPRLFTCVDVAILSPNRRYLYLGKRRAEGTGRFIGGFVDQSDASLEAAARREAREEADADAEHLTYVGSFKIDDHRYKTADDGQLMSAFFVAQNMTTALRAGDDLDELTEVRLDAYTNEELLEAVVPQHRILMGAFINHMGRPE